MEKVKKTISQRLLALLEGGVASTIDIVWAMSVAKSISYKRLSFLRNNPDKTIGKTIVNDWKCNYDEYRRYYALLGKLRRQGLIEVDNKGNKKRWSITKSGLSFITRREQKINKIEALSIPGRATVISYDIPERMRRERGRIREVLKLVGFEQVHQSVWFGNKKVTRQFLDLLRERKIFDYIHIFEVNKKGTLEKVGNASVQ